ncbi:MAG: crotonase/enoyl-CoA hydratase family protein [Paracoccaceae bacterium]
MSDTKEATKTDVVLVERRGHVMIITLNRPEARNAVNIHTHMGVGNALEEAEADPDVWVVILTGAGDKAFCAGADLVAVSRGESLMPDDPKQAAWGFAGFVSHPISKPVIAAVNGFALGGGTELSLAADLVVAADTAAFGLPEVKRGIFAGAGGAFRIVQQLPTKIGMEVVLTGNRLTAQRAHELGLVNRVVPFDQLMDAAMALAEEITVNAPIAVQVTKRIAMGIDNGHIAADDEHWERARREGAYLMSTEDAKEGPRAFAEKREPVWKGR